MQSNLQLSHPNQATETEVKKYKLLIMSGCSGVGKGTLINYLLNRYPQLFQLSVSLTTRNPRQGQLDGRQYHFVSIEEFKKQIQNDVFAEFCEVHGNYYGTHQGKLTQIINKGRICILDIDLQGGQKIYKKMPQNNFVFINPPTFESLEERLTKRGTQSPESLTKRLKNAKGQLEVIKGLSYYDHLVNGNLEKAKEDLIQYINKKYGLNLKA